MCRYYWVIPSKSSYWGSVVLLLVNRTNQLLSRIVSNIGLRKKILSISIFYSFGLIAVSIMAGLTVTNEVSTISTATSASIARINAVNSVNTAIQELAKLQGELIIENDGEATRSASIAMIRKGAEVDEELHKLKTIMPENPLVTRMVELRNQIKPVQLKIIKDARANNDSEALAKSRSISQMVQEIEALVIAVLNQQKIELDEFLAKQKDESLRAILLQGMFVVIGIVVAIMLSFFIVARITKPISVLEDLMHSLAQGNLNLTVPDAGHDEVGRMVRVMGNTVDDLNEIVGNVTNCAVDVSGRADDVSHTANNIKAIAMTLKHMVENIKHESDSVSHSTNSSMQQLHQATTEAEQTAAIAEHAAVELTETANNFIQFRTKIEATAVATNDLAEMANSITTITGTIRDISEQTNLLALNAAIEAARAGEQGRGFAVVADEVRVLATRTDVATSEISQLIERISNQIRSTVTMLQESTEQAHVNVTRLQEVASTTVASGKKTTEMKGIMGEVVNMMNMQADSVIKIIESVGSLVESTNETNSQTDHLHDLAGSLTGASNRLGEVIGKFKLR